MQRIIWAKLAAYSELRSADQSEIRALIADIAETAEEGRALFDILIRGKAPETVSRRTAVELYQQANERLNRPGQQNVCRIYHLILKGTHDERVLKALTKKEQGQTAAIEALRLEITKEARK